MLSINNLYAGYTEDNPILKGLNLTVEDGEVIGILGRNGSGKSTLAKAILGMIPYLDGEIRFNENPLLGKQPFQIARMGIGYFQQGARIFGNLTTKENLDFASSEICRTDRADRFEKMKDWFEILQKPGSLGIKASYLSSGEKHQLALAMVFIQSPELLILDEPSSGLSQSNSHFLLNLLRNAMDGKLKNILLIEQNQNFAKAICSRLLLVENSTITY